MTDPIPERRSSLWRQRGLIALGLAAILAGLTQTPPARFLHYWSIDFLLAARHRALGPLFARDRSQVAVVVVDEETYRTPPFADRPQVAWTPYLAEVMGAIDTAGPAAIGLDLIYPTSLDQPDLLPGFDKPLLKAFLTSGREGRLVLGQVRLSQQEIGPHRRQILAAGGSDNVRTLNLLVDSDEVVRRYPAQFGDESGGKAPSFGMELAKRAGASVPESDFIINYNTGPDDVPVYGLADLYACLAAGRTEFFEQFRNKVVLVGDALDLEDRRTPAKRLTLGRPNRSVQPRCEGQFDPAQFGEIVSRRTLPGVFIHAAAIDTVMQRRPLALMAPLGVMASIGATGAGLASLFFVVPPAAGLAAGFVVLLLLAAGGLWLFVHGVVPPLAFAAIASALTFTLIYAYRFVVEDRTKRWIQHAFRHFLAPALVERLAHDPAALTLGGTRREVTVFFSDIAGFTTLSEALADRPETLVEILNRYLTVMTMAIEAHGGYVDKFIGDAVMAVWGAPLPDAEPECHAVQAGLACLEGLERFNRDVVAVEYGLPPIGTRIGINTGAAIVGNMGSASRLNYTVTGDIVNLAARLEGANKVYGSKIMIGDGTARGLKRAGGPRFMLRRLDRLVVKGKHVPVKVYEVVGLADRIDPARAEAVRRFHAALCRYYRRDFAAAEAAFAALALDDPAARLYRDRAAYFREKPPGPDWDRSFALDSK